MNVRRISISEFKTHCIEEISAVEKGGLILEVTRHGKTVAIVQPPHTSPAPTLAEWVGSGEGTITFGPNYDPAGSAWDNDNWD